MPDAAGRRSTSSNDRDCAPVRYSTATRASGSSRTSVEISPQMNSASPIESGASKNCSWLARAERRLQILAQAVGIVFHHGGGRVEDRLRGAIVFFEANDLCAGKSSVKRFRFPARAPRHP